MDEAGTTIPLPISRSTTPTSSTATLASEAHSSEQLPISPHVSTPEHRDSSTKQQTYPGHYYDLAQAEVQFQAAPKGREPSAGSRATRSKKNAGNKLSVAAYKQDPLPSSDTPTLTRFTLNSNANVFIPSVRKIVIKDPSGTELDLERLRSGQHVKKSSISAKRITVHIETPEAKEMRLAQEAEKLRQQQIDIEQEERRMEEERMRSEQEKRERRRKEREKRQEEKKERERKQQENKSRLEQEQRDEEQRKEEKRQQREEEQREREEEQKAHDLDTAALIEHSLVDKKHDTNEIILNSPPRNTFTTSVSVYTSARALLDLNDVSYPGGCERPDAALNANAEPGKFRYDRDFLLQFMLSCREKPHFLIPLGVFGLEPRPKSRRPFLFVPSTSGAGDGTLSASGSSWRRIIEENLTDEVPGDKGIGGVNPASIPNGQITGILQRNKIVRDRPPHEKQLPSERYADSQARIVPKPGDVKKYAETEPSMHGQRSKFWKQDGSVVLRVSNVYFRLHRTRLIERSRYFAVLFSESQISRNMMDGCPLYDIDVNVTAEDFEELLTILDDGIVVARTSPTFETIAAVLRASTALEFTVLRNWAVSSLETMWPSDLQNLSDKPIPHAQEAFCLARTFDLRGVLKRAAYDLARTDSSFWLLSSHPSTGIGALSDALRRFSREDVLLLMTIHKQLVGHWLDVCDVTAPDCPSTAYLSGCLSLDAKRAKWMIIVHESGLFKTWAQDPVCGLERLAKLDWAAEGYCGACVTAKKNMWTAMRESIWQALEIWLAS